jgi:hypothetical protein
MAGQLVDKQMLAICRTVHAFHSQQSQLPFSPSRPFQL